MAEDVNKKKTISHTLGIVHINRLLDIQVALWIGNDSHNVKVVNFFVLSNQKTMAWWICDGSRNIITYLLPCTPFGARGSDKASPLLSIMCLSLNDSPVAI